MFGKFLKIREKKNRKNNTSKYRFFIIPKRLGRI